MKRGRRQLTCAMLLVVVSGGLLWTWPDVALAGPTGGDQDAVVAGNTEFALNLYARLRTDDGNLFLSPYSVSTALAMTYAGARGETARQMADVLHFSLESERLHPAFAELESSVKAAGDSAGCSLDVANALWGQRGERFLEGFLALTKKHYGAGFQEVDFAGATEQARKTINAWVADQTRQKIKELLQGRDVDSATALVLTNAIYFKGSWASQFDPRHTKNAPFWINEGEKVVVPTMHQVRRFAFASAGDLDILELPYDGDRLSMLVLLPKAADGLADLERSLSKENLDKWQGSLREQAVRVHLPRFKLESRLDLATTLEALGMNDAFSASKADFSGINGRRDLFISLVIHQAQADVNEEGTEAAAATAVGMKMGAPPTAFVADHPFLFLIRDQQTGSILFLGRVVNPGK